MTQALGGQVALVTGAGQGLGAAIAARLAEAGARVIVADRNAQTGETVAASVGGRFAALDITDETAWTALMAEIAGREGRLDILVNNAGTEGDPAAGKGPQDTPLQDWTHILNVNATGTFLACRAALDLLGAEGGGAIVNVASVAALVPSPFITAYGASKAAVDHLTRSVALHGAQVGAGVRCNAVFPGQVRTPMLDAIFDRLAATTGQDKAAFIQGFLDTIPQGRFQEPQEIAAAVQFLCSPDAAAITGQGLVVDGGFTLTH